MAINRELVLDVLLDSKAEMAAGARIFLAAVRTDDEGAIELPRDRAMLRLIHKKLARLDQAIAFMRVPA